MSSILLCLDRILGLYCKIWSLLLFPEYRLIMDMNNCSQADFSIILRTVIFFDYMLKNGFVHQLYIKFEIFRFLPLNVNVYFPVSQNFLLTLVNIIRISCFNMSKQRRSMCSAKCVFFSYRFTEFIYISSTNNLQWGYHQD